jgi:hypothetical protein
MTLEEKRAIEEEARNSGITEASSQAQALRDEQQGTAPGPKIPGRDSGFCSEQDQHGQQVQGMYYRRINTHVLIGHEISMYILVRAF